MLALASVCHLLAAQATPPAAPAQPLHHTRLVILDLLANGVDENLVKSLTDRIAVTLQAERIVDDVASAADLRAMMSIEADRQQLGKHCDESDACMAEVAQALGADVLVHGSVGRFGELYSVALSLFDARDGRAIAREKAEAKTLELLSKRVTFVTRRIALAYADKDVALAGEEPREDDDVSPLLVAGGAVGGLGAVSAVASGIAAGVSYATLRNPKSIGSEKLSAETAYPAFFIAAATAAVVGLGGAAMAVVAVVRE